MPDINDLSLLSEIIEVDGEIPADWFKLELPDDGDYNARIKMTTRGIEILREKTEAERKAKVKDGTGPGYLAVHAMFTILDPNGQETRLSAFKDFFDTRIEERKGVRTSPVHAAFALAGFPLHSAKNLADLKQAIEVALAQNPVVGIRVRQSAQGKVTGAGGKVSYEMVFSSQKAMPPILDENGNPTGRHETEGIDPKSGQAWKAQARVTEFFPATK